MSLDSEGRELDASPGYIVGSSTEHIKLVIHVSLMLY